MPIKYFKYFDSIKKYDLAIHVSCTFPLDKLRVLFSDCESEATEYILLPFIYFY